MRKLLCGLVGVAALLQSGCALIREEKKVKADIEHVKSDFKGAMEIWRQKLAPEFENLKARLIKADEDITRDVKQAQKMWSTTFVPQISETKKIVKDIAVDVKKTREFWTKDVEPRLASLETTMKKMEQDIAKVVDSVEAEAKTVLAKWHTEFETHLNQLERVVGTVNADVKQFEQKYDQLKAGLRTVTTRVADDVKHNTVVTHVEKLVTHVETLAQSHSQGITQTVINQARADVSAGVRAVMQAF